MPRRPQKWKSQPALTNSPRTLHSALRTLYSVLRTSYSPFVSFVPFVDPLCPSSLFFPLKMEISTPADQLDHPALRLLALRPTCSPAKATSPRRGEPATANASARTIASATGSMAARLPSILAVQANWSSAFADNLKSFSERWSNVGRSAVLNVTFGRRYASKSCTSTPCCVPTVCG